MKTKIDTKQRVFVAHQNSCRWCYCICDGCTCTGYGGCELCKHMKTKFDFRCKKKFLAKDGSQHSCGFKNFAKVDQVEHVHVCMICGATESGNQSQLNFKREVEKP